ncbi:MULTISPECIES: flavin reductase family protein [Chromobacterium]|uniref:Flavin reductase family protein n=1 Tax=Chromobacterium aquaticum TaxID=467180 RepID=A0ABV8ZX64_9NEIS|nr:MULTISPECIES: flavin reductase family protein [Chromobacterium]KMN37595.1 flavin reductase [Chromobacterium sp. LK1]MCD5360686.1 flavin reductase family protein [Chromobacterium aquaticum]
MDCDISALPAESVYPLLVGSVQPRPIAWVSTQDLHGVANLAPFSFFTVASVSPPVLALSILTPAAGGEKDTLANIRATGEFVVNVVSERLAEAMNVSCGPYAAEVDEFDLAGVGKARSRQVKAPGVELAPLRFECVLSQCLALGQGAGAGNLVLGEVRHVHVADEAWRDGRLHSDALALVGKLGGDDFSRAEPAFSLRRPGA